MQSRRTGIRYAALQQSTKLMTEHWRFRLRPSRGHPPAVLDNSWPCPPHLRIVFHTRNSTNNDRVDMIKRGLGDLVPAIHSVSTSSDREIEGYRRTWRRRNWADSFIISIGRSSSRFSDGSSSRSSPNGCNRSACIWRRSRCSIGSEDEAIEMRDRAS